MNQEEFQATEESVRAAYDSNGLVEVIFSYANHNNDQLRKICVQLHNTGAIDLLGLASTTEFRSANTKKPFAGQKFYRDVLSELQAPVSSLIRFIRALSTQEGEDVRALFPHEALRRWCSKDLNRAREIIDSAHHDETLAREFLTVALMAGNYRNDAREFIENYSDARRVSGIFALGKMQHASTVEAHEAIELLCEVISACADELVYTTALSAAFDIKKEGPNADSDRLKIIVDQVRLLRSASTLDAFAQVLLHHPNELSDDLLSIFLDELHALAPTQTDTIRTLDFALSQLVTSHRANEGIDFLRSYLQANSQSLSLADFSSTTHALKAAPAQLQETLVSWLLAADDWLCRQLVVVFRDYEDRPFDFDFSIAHLERDRQEVVCRKAVGYFFTQPSLACSFLVCVLRQCTDQVALEIGELLFDPILRSYGGKPRAYLASISSDDKAFERVQPALQTAQKYTYQLESVGTIKEIHPPESARLAVMLRDFDEMQIARKQAEKDSIFLNVVTRSTVLHGRRTLSYMRPDEPDHDPMEMELHSHSFGIELPRQDALDPVGLDFALGILRVWNEKS